MSVYRPKRKDGSFKSPYYQFDFTLKINGESVRFHGSTGEAKEKDAASWEAREKTRLKSEKPFDSMTLDMACFRFYEEVGQHRESADDIAKAYEHCCRLIGGTRKLINITSEDIATAVRRRSAETVGTKNPRLITGATVNRQIVEPMQRLLRRAHLVWKVSCDPGRIDWSQLKMREPKGRVREFSTEEANSFWPNLRDDYVPCVTFLIGRGIRVRSALGMKKFDVDLARGTANVHMKGEGMTKIHLSPDQCALIRAEIKKCPSSPMIWTYIVQRGKDNGKRKAITYDALRRVIGTAFKSAGITDFHIHDLRHDFASKLLRRTNNLAIVQTALGHSDIKSTVRYAHVLGEDVANAMQGMPTGIAPETPESKAKLKKATD